MKYEVIFLRGEGNIVLFAESKEKAESAALWLSKNLDFCVAVSNGERSYLAFHRGNGTEL